MSYTLSDTPVLRRPRLRLESSPPHLRSDSDTDWSATQKRRVVPTQRNPRRIPRARTPRKCRKPRGAVKRVAKSSRRYLICFGQSRCYCGSGTFLTVLFFLQTDRKEDLLFFASDQSLSYLDGTLPADYGFDPLGLSDPEGAGGFVDPDWLRYSEVIHCRW